MLFNSLHFLLFFPIVTAAYYLLPAAYRYLLLLGASIYFYMVFKPVYILILGFTIVIDYFAGIYIEKAPIEKKKTYLIISILANVSVLAIFKYAHFFNENLSTLLHALDTQNPFPALSIVLPIGLSFHTFQAMSYTIEVYKGRQKAERHFGIYALYVMFYPQLVAGPIERPQNILPQLHTPQKWNAENLEKGLKMMIWGFFCKVVIADRLAEYVDIVYTQPQAYSGLTLAVAAVFFSFQIYGDFCGYSLIALGTAKAMGYDLMHNFRAPYFASSLSDFWRRWHISLSTWFRDYVYIPLGGNRKGKARMYLNLLIVFTLSGLWHGASWNFVIWGMIHGVLLIAWEITASMTKRTVPQPFSKAIGTLFTFCIVTIAWIFFRAKDLSQALYILQAIPHFSLDFSTLADTILVFTGDSSALSHAFVNALMLSILLIKDSQQLPQTIRQKLYSSSIIWYLLICLILFFGNFQVRSFIYFQF